MNEINLNYLNGNYSFYKNDKNNSKKEEIQKEEVQANTEIKTRTKPENVLSAMDAIGLQNFAMAKMGVAEIDTTKYVDAASEQRIADSMAAFEQFMNTAQSEGIPQSVAEQAALRFIG